MCEVFCDCSTCDPTGPRAQLRLQRSRRGVIPNKDRSTSFRIFLEEQFDLSQIASVLDVAGGRGDLSGQLVNLYDISAVVLDPRPLRTARLRRCWAQVVLGEYGMHEVDIGRSLARAAEAQSVSAARLAMALAVLRPAALNAAHAAAPQAVAALEKVPAEWHEPQALQTVLTKDLVAALGDEQQWELAWAAAQRASLGHEGNAPIYAHLCSSSALDGLAAIRAAKLVVAFHPDQATEPAIDMALALNIPFAVVPCCVFPSKFPERRLNGKPVSTYTDFLAYLTQKHPRIRRSTLAFTSDAGTAKNVVLYLTADDLRK
eukprot:TRINITY_DN26928_c0_g1_i1.p1 TRINITY_DN26928_c0_g1~~TRINITY_DN26928_c0_g1_i1.p1  ORF type:complete len:317 (+),score=51.37 TRINITY_DN26928_c0_g1_i1:47-997(+)